MRRIETGHFQLMSKSGQGGGSGRDGRLASALRDNLRRRKAASRPAEGEGQKPAAEGRPNATLPEKAAGGGRED